jgi:hypothetical protein
VGFAQRIGLLEDELVEVHLAREMAEENSCGMSDIGAYVERWREESERECWERVEELSLLQTRGFELCQEIVGPSRVRSHLLEGM